MLTISATSTALATVIFSHGLGQTNESWMPWVQRLSLNFPHVRWILPQAETGPITYDNEVGPRWFDVRTLPPGADEDDTLTADASKKYIQGIVEDVLQENTPSYKIILIGFSQGSAISLLSGLTSKHALGGIAVLSGWFPFILREMVVKERSALPVSSPCPPIFWAHGTADVPIPLQNALETMQWLRSSLPIEETGITFKEYPGLKHEVNDEVMRDLTAWLAKLL